MKYNYMEAMIEDVREYINNEIEIAEYKGDADGLREYLYDTLWITDSVTGNASGSYFFSTYKAEEAIAHNWDLLADALSEFGCNGVNAIAKGAEWCDVTVRCYLLGQAIDEVIEELAEELEEE